MIIKIKLAGERERRYWRWFLVKLGVIFAAMFAVAYWLIARLCEVAI